MLSFIIPLKEFSDTFNSFNIFLALNDEVTAFVAAEILKNMLQWILALWQI